MSFKVVMGRDGREAGLGKRTDNLADPPSVRRRRRMRSVADGFWDDGGRMEDFWRINTDFVTDLSNIFDMLCPNVTIIDGQYSYVRHFKVQSYFDT